MEQDKSNRANLSLAQPQPNFKLNHHAHPRSQQLNQIVRKIAQMLPVAFLPNAKFSNAKQFFAALSCKRHKHTDTGDFKPHYTNQYSTARDFKFNSAF